MNFGEATLPQDTLSFNSCKKSNKAYDMANSRCIETLLNCFHRETLVTGKYVQILNHLEISHFYSKLPNALINYTGLFMRLNLTTIKHEIIVGIKYNSKIGFFHYQSLPYLKKIDSLWQELDWQTLANILLQELANHYEQPFNDELLKQIKNSVQVMTDSLSFCLQTDIKKTIDLSFIESEQSLLFGHTFHPSPKSRENLTPKNIYDFSPEFKAKFSLNYFSVKKEYIIQESLLKKSAIDIIQENSPSFLQKNHEDVLICTHPWEAQYLKQVSIIKSALKNNYLKDLGQLGEEYSPTSSIRTLYHPDNSFFYKFSLHVRITNCIRKNSIYELKTAVFLTKILLTTLANTQHQFPHFHLMLEPAFLSVDFKNGSKEERQSVTEGFGMIFRENFSPAQLAASTPILAGTLFGKSLWGNSYIFNTIESLSHHLRINYETAATRWFNRYIEMLLYPLLYYHFNLGITFEPHLQNILIGMKDNLPMCIFVRDLEGTKLRLAEWPIDFFSQLDETAKQSLNYSEPLSWNRITYCLFANNLGEAIFHIAHGDLKLETKLWSIVKQHLVLFQEQYGNESSKKRIYGLLSNDPLPVKGNLTTRFLKRNDKQAVYYYLMDHPLKEEKETTL